MTEVEEGAVQVLCAVLGGAPSFVSENQDLSNNKIGAFVNAIVKLTLFQAKVDYTRNDFQPKYDPL